MSTIALLVLFVLLTGSALVALSLCRAAAQGDDMLARARDEARAKQSLGYESRERLG